MEKSLALSTGGDGGNDLVEIEIRKTSRGRLNNLVSRRSVCE